MEVRGLFVLFATTRNGAALADHWLPLAGSCIVTAFPCRRVDIARNCCDHHSLALACARQNEGDKTVGSVASASSVRPEGIGLIAGE